MSEAEQDEKAGQDPERLNRVEKVLSSLQETSLRNAAGAQDLTIEDLTCFAPCGMLRPVGF